MRLGLFMGGLFLLIGSVCGHSFDAVSLEYILSQEGNTANRTEFEQKINDINPDFQKSIPNISSKIAIALSLPQNESISASAKQNPDFSLEDLTQWADGNPMLGELGIDNVYTFLKEFVANPDKDILFEDKAEESAKGSISVWEYFVLGREHIIGGYDHLLFVLALVLALPGVRYILRIITTFTVAHSITILLGSLGLIVLPSVFVESVIVISIIFAALMSRNKKVGEPTSSKPWKEMILVFILGLIHGLGFSSFFIDVSGSTSDLVLPILGFNLGVEVGQLLVLGLFVILLGGVYALAKDKKDIVKKGLIVLLCCIALYWILMMRI